MISGILFVGVTSYIFSEVRDVPKQFVSLMYVVMYLFLAPGLIIPFVVIIHKGKIEEEMSAPSTANRDKLANPARPKPNQQVVTESGAWGGNEPCKALKKIGVSHNASEGIEPRNNSILHRVKEFIFWKPASERALTGECESGKPGSESVAGTGTVFIGTWESRNEPYRSPRETEEVGRGHDVTAVGLTHSRGVGRVMSAESISSLEGVSVLTQREED